MNKTKKLLDLLVTEDHDPAKELKELEAQMKSFKDASLKTTSDSVVQHLQHKMYDLQVKINSLKAKKPE